MFQPNKNFQQNLDEELSSLGVVASDMVRLSSQRLDENTSGALAAPIAVIGQPQASDEEDPLDGKFVSRELLGRIANLPFDAMEDSDFDELLNALAEKELPEGDEELHNLAEEVVKAIIEARQSLDEGLFDIFRTRKGKRAKKAKAGFKTVDGKAKKKTAKERMKTRMRKIGSAAARAARAAKKWARTAKGKLSKKASERRAAKKNEGLGYELDAILEGADSSMPHYETLSRLEGVLALLPVLIDDDSVQESVESAFDMVKDRLHESDGSDESALAAFKPALQVISKCLEHIDNQENDENPL